MTRLTEIHLPKSLPFSPGIAEWGEVDVATMIEKLRARAAYLRAEAEAIEAAADHEFQVSTYVGVHVQRNRRELQRSSRLEPS